MISGPHLLWDPFSCLWMLFWSLCFSRLPLCLCLCLCLSLAGGLCCYHSWKPRLVRIKLLVLFGLSLIPIRYLVTRSVTSSMMSESTCLLRFSFFSFFSFLNLWRSLLGTVGHCGALDSEEMTLRALLPSAWSQCSTLCSLYLFSLHCILHLMLCHKKYINIE